MYKSAIKRNKIMKATKKEEELLLNIYRALYKEATPSADFYRLVESGERFYLDYYLEQSRQDEIVEEFLRTIKATRLKKQMLRNTVFNYSPKGTL